MLNEYILYACPTGPMAEQIERYFATSQAQCGPNAAHRYPPHCTLTGFFHDNTASVPGYITALDAAIERGKATRPSAILTVNGLQTSAEWIGLAVEGPWLKSLVADFATAAASPTRRDALRLKDRLHLSLAYEFPAEQCSTLAQLAHTLIAPAAPVGWELRFYEREPGDVWRVLEVWK